MTTSATRTNRELGTVDVLAWLRAALWSPDADVALVPVDRADRTATWLARPTGADPELLVPLSSRRAAAGASRRFWDGMPATRRGRQWAGEIALRSGLAQRAWPGRVAVLGAAADLEDPERSLIARLAADLDKGPLSAAVTARPSQYNAKPVLALFDGHGRVVAFAKVAVDAVSEAYVRTEITWLKRAAAAPPPLRSPRLLATVEWQDRPVAVLEALALPRLPRRRPGWADDAVIAAIVGLGPVERRVVTDTGPVVRARADAQLAADDELTAAVDAVVEAHPEVEVEVGVWHGDLSPWNTASRRHEVLVWDWELAAEGMPLGSDRRHAAVMVATHLDGRTASDALDGVDAGDPAVALYLIELVRRDREARRSGRNDAFAQMGDAALRRLHQEGLR